VLFELRWGRNSIRVEPYASRRRDSSSFRARWNTIPLVGGSPLFHRWQLLAGSSMYVDIALDCREANLQGAADLVSNNNTTHRITRAFRNGPTEFESTVKRLRVDRESYTRLVEACPPPTGLCVYSKEVTKDGYSARPRYSSLVLAWLPTCAPLKVPQRL